jgi:hypothetical protein
LRYAALRRSLAGRGSALDFKFFGFERHYYRGLCKAMELS